MRCPLSPRIPFLLLSLLVTITATPAETELERPPALYLNHTPDACETPVALSELTLQDAVKIALCKAPNVRQAHSAIEESAANLHVAQAKYLPSLHADADANRTGKHVRYPAHSAANYDLHAYSGNARLGLNWLLFDFGQRRAQNDQARAELSAALYNKILVNRDQAITVADCYYRASSAQAGAAAAREAAARAEKNYHVIKRLREGGVGSIADELLAKVAWQRSLVDSETKAAEAERTTLSLATAVGLPGHTRISLPVAPARTTHRHDARSSGQGATPHSFDERIIDAVRSHPRLAVARANTAAAEAEAQSIQAQHRPRISLQANRDIGITPPATSVAKQHVNTWSIGLTVHIPIFDGLSTQYATEAAQARTRTARETERTVWLQEEQKLLTDLSHMARATQKIAFLDDAESSAIQAYRSAQIRYQQGVGTATELLNAQDELAALQQTAIDVHYERLATQFRLAVALDTLPPAPADFH